MGKELSPACIVLEIPLHQADPHSIAARLSESELIQEANQKSPARISFHPAASSVYAVLESDDMLQAVHELSAFLEPVKAKAQEEASEITAKISSQNDLGRIAELIKEKGPLGWIDSLAVEFRFAKTEAVERLVGIVLDKFMGMPDKAVLVKTFRRLNLELNCSSSHHLDEYQKLKLPPHPEPLKANDLVQILKDAGAAQVRL